jgi:hypothetical protein
MNLWFHHHVLALGLISLMAGWFGWTIWYAGGLPPAAGTTGLEQTRNWLKRWLVPGQVALMLAGLLLDRLL